MKKLLLGVLIFYALSGAVTGYAQKTASKNTLRYHKASGATDFSNPATSRNLLNAVAANASAANRTITIDVKGYAKTTIVFVLTRGGDAATATITCSGSLDGGTTYGTVQARAISSGVATLTDFSDSRATGGSSFSIAIDYGVSTYTHFKCVFATDTSNASDTITVQATSEVGR
jgi:hypothetical protein